MNGIKTMWIAVAAVAAVALVIVGYAWGASRGSSSILAGGGSYDSGFAAGTAAAQKKLENSGIIPKSPATVMSVSGTVKSVDTDRFVIAANPVSMNPLEPQGPTERTIVINDKTQITGRAQMPPDDFAAAMKTFQDSMKSGTKAVVPPSPYTEKPATINDIKIGMMVTVTAASDIKTADTINATQVTFDALPSKAPGDTTTPVAPTAPNLPLPPPIPPVTTK
jgi:hypothetical protein